MEPLESRERRERICELVSKIREEEHVKRKGTPQKTASSGTYKRKQFVTKQSQRTSFIYLGWKHRESASSQYVQVRGLDRGGGLRRIPFKEYSRTELLDEAKKIFFPGNISKYEKVGKLDECECILGNFAGDVLSSNESEKNFSVSEYLSGHGLYASRVRFYLLTTKKGLSSADDESLEDVASKCQLQIEQSDCTSSVTLSNPSTSGHLSGEMQSLNEMKRQEQEHSLYIDGERKLMEVEFNHDVVSRYTSEISSCCIVGWSNCFQERSIKFFECSIEEYHPCDDDFVVRCINVNDQVYVQPDTENDSSMFPEVYTYPMDDFQKSELPVILHEPDKIYGYDSDNNVLIGIVTNFHNEIGVTYTWYRNQDVYLSGSLHPVIKVNSTGVYHCKIQYGDKVLTSSAVEVLELDTSCNRENTSVKQQAQYIVEIPLEKIEVNWKEPVGVGSFGKVYHGTWLCTDVAIKQIRRGATVKESIQREASIHSRLRHPNIVTFMGMSIKKKDVLLITEFVEGKSLQDHIEDEEQISEAVKLGIVRDILKGIAYLHEVDVVHSDIKPANVLLSTKLNVAKLCDFGLGRLRQHASMSVLSHYGSESILEGTPPYMAPECLLGKKRATPLSDIWSLGITLLEFFTLSDAWEGVLEKFPGDVLSKLTSAFTSKMLPDSISKLNSHAKVNISMCLSYDTESRPSALKLLEQSW